MPESMVLNLSNGSVARETPTPCSHEAKALQQQRLLIYRHASDDSLANKLWDGKASRDNRRSNIRDVIDMVDRKLGSSGT